MRPRLVSLLAALAGDTRETSVFPSGRFTVPDATQATGLRVDLRRRTD